MRRAHTLHHRLSYRPWYSAKQGQAPGHWRAPHRPVYTDSGEQVRLLLPVRLARRITTQGRLALLPPLTRIKVVQDTYFGTTIEDPYRWLEDWKGDEAREWVAAQGNYARCPGWLAHLWFKAMVRAVDTAPGHRPSARCDQVASLGWSWRL